MLDRKAEKATVLGVLERVTRFPRSKLIELSNRPVWLTSRLTYTSTRGRSIPVCATNVQSQLQVRNGTRSWKAPPAAKHPNEALLIPFGVVG